ncbi:MAG: leucyl/phenylalanyl-tRNA--protein transferase [Actinomycetota bacterium]|nr:leucyl/phenylalanyl-tRNA--protein transferase [Actinomycetota bacterium]
MDTGRVPIEPAGNRWRLPSPELADESGLCGIGADLAPGTLLAAYRSGIFPMPLRKKTLGWWSPDPRGMIPLDGLIVSRSLRRSCRRYELRFNTRFREVMERCADPNRSHGWITPQFVDAYEELHRLGWAHSIETYLHDRLVGGLYWVRIARLFAGESMFSAATDASKVALVGLVEWLGESGAMLLDVQWTTPHLASVGAVDVPRRTYLELLAEAIADR